jgi:hypothetical protein
VALPTTDLFNGVQDSLRIGSNGDYQDMSGADLLRKLVLRRLMTPRGGFFHLPQYGLGIIEKRLWPDIAVLKGQVEREVRREPEVVDDAASIQLTTGGVLTVRVKAVLVSGTVISVSTSR